ncbi:hypothetical protein EY643_01420 [Halioglobus maricola]|uniref:Sulfotransferase family protein n=1 Tax=Halioglobus maricola TaxID=2601894 RepID=A0A5P9NF65_9GAMM|nr:sulfotransferase family 2 domain-containing protein [Halioglobus maricola]QFU74417.1 hypothetical protein EY643_01420 [Halioglobus maricola]
MISHKYKCIFIHVPKAGGTTISRSQSFHDEFTSPHLRWERLANALNQHSDYYVFGQVRHPITRILSAYNHSNRSHESKEFYKRQTLSFREYLERVLITRQHFRRGTDRSEIFEIAKEIGLSEFDVFHTCAAQKDYFDFSAESYLNSGLKINPEVRLNYCMKVEHFDSDWSHVLSDLKLDYVEPKIRDHGSKSKKKYWTQQLDLKTVQLIYRCYKEDFNALGYKLVFTKNLPLRKVIRNSIKQLLRQSSGS